MCTHAIASTWLLVTLCITGCIQILEIDIYIYIYIYIYNTHTKFCKSTAYTIHAYIYQNSGVETRGALAAGASPINGQIFIK